MSTGILDTYTARIAYALRRLKSTYSGNCLRVRRSSDDTEQDIGFDSDGIINWSDASSFAGGNDLFVVKHYDQSGNGNHRSQATNSKQPKLNLSTHQIEFDGTDDYLATESAVDLSATDKLSFYTKLKRLGSTGTYQFFAFTEGASIGGNGLQCYFYHTSSKYTIYDSNTAANTREDSTSISGAGTERLISVIIDRALTTSSEMLFYADNTSQTGGSAGNNSGNFPSAIWQFGVYSATMFFGNYQQSEFILFDSAHDGTDRTFIESDISSGLGATPPPDSTPPTDCVLGTPTALTATSARFPISTLSTDAGAGMQKYLFEFDTVDTFDSADKITVYHNATTSPFDKTGLTAGRRWFARAKGVDNAATPNLSTNWSNTVHVDLAPTINTTSLNSAIIHEPFSQTLSKTGGAGTFEIRSGAPSGFAIDDETGEITWGDSDPLGEIEDIVIRYTVTASGLYAEVTFSITVVEAIIVPVSRWSKLNLVPLKDSLFWNALDVAEDATQIGDFSGNDNKLAVASSAPVLQTDVINGKPGVYFDGTNNPLKFTTDLTLKHLFLVAKFDGATFTGNEGLLSGVAATSILRGNGNTTTKFANLAIGSGFVYKKNYVALTESTQNAPMNSFAILELIFPSGISLDGIQIGQDTTNTGRKWKGWFIEQIGYGEVQDDCNRRSIYEYFALKFWLWRYKSDNYPYFPFVFNRSSKHRSTELAEISEAEGLRGSDRVVRYLDDAPLHSYDLEFNYRFYLEYLATVQFLNERRLHLPFWIEDIERTFERRMTRTTELTDNGYGSAYKFDYNFGVKDY